MSGQTYYELLKRPLWQKKRLEIMQRAGFECEDCGTGAEQLHIHHSYYEKGLKPWEYPEESLHCLCEDCHAKAQDVKAEIERRFGSLSLEQHGQVLGYLLGLEMESAPMIFVEVTNYEVAMGIADAFGLTAEEIIDALEDRQIDGFKLTEMSKRKRQQNS